MKTGSKIKIDVQDELALQPTIAETKIGVTVDNGVVTLSGKVDSYTKIIAASKRVNGVKIMAEDIEVKYGDNFKKTDKEIAKAAVDALEWISSVPEDEITVKVEDG